MLFANHTPGAIRLQHRFHIRALLLLLAGCLLLSAYQLTIPHRHAAATTNQLIITFDPTLNDREAARSAVALREQFGAQGLRELTPLSIDSVNPVYLADLSPRIDAAALVATLADSPLVAQAERNAPRRTLTIDERAGPRDSEFIAQEYYNDIGIVAMWSRGLTGSNPDSPVTVAVIDTGVDLDHPDIDANVVPGFDFVEDDDLAQDVSSNSHGSSVAGIISAEINNDLDGVGRARGVAGIGGGDAQDKTPGLQLMPLRIVADKSGALSCATIAEAIDYARIHGAQVINISIGGVAPCTLERAAIERAYADGIAVVAAAGNGNSAAPFYPAAYGAGTVDTMVIAVAGVDADGVKAARSNYGSWVDIAAPFQDIRTLSADGGYLTRNGTSFSAPFVSGLLGVLMSNYGWSRDEAIAAILTTADNLDSVNPEYAGLLGAGRINADRASALFAEYTMKSAPANRHTLHLPLIVQE
jgi:subtilisin family serine protease